MQKQKPVISVSVTGVVDNEELDEIKNILDDGDLGDEYEIVVHGDGIELSELPALDDHIDELADRIAERLNA